MKKTKRIVFLFAAMMLALTLIPVFTYAAEATPAYQSLDELSGKRFAYVNGSVYNQRVQEKIDGTTEEFYPSLSECVAAVEAGKADAVSYIQRDRWMQRSADTDLYTGNRHI